MKDRFSSGSQLYQLARPSYPASLIQEILNMWRLLNLHGTVAQGRDN